MRKDINRSARTAGIDEAGRGSLAGPVVAAVVILSPKNSIPGLVDSKKLTAKKRLQLCQIIKSNAIGWGVGFASAKEIDKWNIHHATLRAMWRAYRVMRIGASRVLVDGLYCPELPTKCVAVVKGDQKVPTISAASILAKVTRDTEMESYHSAWPQYGFDRHKGYPTAQHVAALQKFGPCVLHRKSYEPVRKAMVSKRQAKSAC